MICGELAEMHAALHPPRRGWVPARSLLPALLVVALAVLGPTVDGHDECAASDGPQFKCWLLREQRG